MKLYFLNSRNKERLIAEPLSREECFGEIHKFLDEHNFKSRYQRVWEEEGRIWVDVGSWSEFFIIEGLSITEFDEHKRKENENVT